MFQRWLIRDVCIAIATIWLAVLVGSLWWGVIVVAGVIIAYQVGIRTLLFFQNFKGRQVFYATACPACHKRYERADVRRAKHLVKSKVFGGPPPAPFSAQFYEAWELQCGACGHTQDFDRGRNVIVFEE